jgi:NAD(P)H-hydrate epimerase
MKDFGYDVDILYPKKMEKDLYLRLIQQCERYSIKFVNIDVIDNLNDYDLILDSIFGFSFKGEVRSPFDKIIKVILIQFILH